MPTLLCHRLAVQHGRITNNQLRLPDQKQRTIWTLSTEQARWLPALSKNVPNHVGVFLFGPIGARLIGSSVGDVAALEHGHVAINEGYYSGIMMTSGKTKTRQVWKD